MIVEPDLDTAHGASRTARAAGVLAALFFAAFTVTAALALWDGDGSYLDTSVVVFLLGAAALIVRDVAGGNTEGTDH